MNVSVQRLAPGEPDYDLLALGVSGGSALLGGSWLAAGLPVPRCPFHAITGCPCPTCGATRCALALLRGQAREALAWNPLAFVALLGAFAFGLYAAIVTLARLPRLRVIFSGLEARLARLGAAAALLANWAYLIHHGV